MWRHVLFFRLDLVPFFFPLMRASVCVALSFVSFSVLVFMFWAILQPSDLSNLPTYK